MGEASEASGTTGERRTSGKRGAGARTRARASEGLHAAVGAGMTWPPAQPFALVLERARQLEQGALSLLYRRFLPVVYRYTLARVGDVHLAEDLTAETCFVMVEQIARVRAEDELGFSAWLLGIARNKVALHFRGQQVQRETLDALPDATTPLAGSDEGDPLAIITARESWSEVVAALQLLTEDQRTVVLYRCVLGFSAEAVGEMMGKQPGTVRGLQFRALATLARHLRHSDHVQQAERVGTATRRERRQHHASR